MASTKTLLLALAFSNVPRLAHADDAAPPASVLRPTDILVAVDQDFHAATPITAPPPVDNDRIEDLETGASLWHLGGGVMLGFGVAVTVLGVAAIVDYNRCDLDCEGEDVLGALGIVFIGLPASVGGVAMYRHGSRLQDEADHLRAPRTTITPSIGRNTVGFTLTW